MNGLPTQREVRKEEEKLAKTERSRRRKTAAVVISILSVLGILGFVAYRMIAAAIDAEASKVPHVIPSSADTVVVAPNTKEWWSNITNMAPLTFNVQKLDPSSADLNIERIAYARFPDAGERDVANTGPVRSIYMESPSEEDAVKVESWINGSDGGEQRAVHRSGTIVQITYNWINSFETPSESLSSRDDFSMSEDAKNGQMWMDFDNQIDSLSGINNSDKPVVKEYFQKNFALKDRTVWSGESNDGVSWSGKYVRGGMDINLFDPEASRKSLMATQKEIGGNENGFKAYENNLYSLIINSGFKKSGENTNHGAVEVPVVEPAVKDEKLTAVVEPSQWNTAVMGLSAQNEGVNRIAFSMSGSAMNLVLRYGANAKVSEMPAFQTPGENTTPVEITPGPPVPNP